MIFGRYKTGSENQDYQSLGLEKAKLSLRIRVGHCVLFRSERIVLLHSFKERNVLLRSFYEFLATYETRPKRTQNVAVFFLNIYIYIYIDKYR